jgi:hypothetical protein
MNSEWSVVNPTDVGRRFAYAQRRTVHVPKLRHASHARFYDPGLRFVGPRS